MKFELNKSNYVIPLVVTVTFLTSLACSLPFLRGKENQEKSPTSQSTEMATAFELNGATLDGITSISEGMPTGLILSVQVTNPTTDEVVVTIPCGMIFEPSPGSDEQPLMSIQQVVEGIPPGGTSELKPYLVCIDSRASIPENGSIYQVGTMAAGDLQAFASCLCREQLDTSILGFQDMFSIQFAIWMVADGISPENMSEQFGDVAGEEIYEILGPMLEALVDPAKEWLDKCDINIQQ